jgi:GxxExxY protein
MQPDKKLHDGDKHDDDKLHTTVQMPKRMKSTDTAACLVDEVSLQAPECYRNGPGVPAYSPMLVDYAFVQALAMDLYETLGPGFSESVYQKALSYDLCEKHIPHEIERVIPVMYKQLQIGVLRADIVVDNNMVVELKRVVKITLAHQQQAERYARLLNLSKIIVINFPCVATATVEVSVFLEDGLWGKLPPVAN